MKKFFVLDTNVLLHDPNAIFQFHDNTVIIPIIVLEELDRFKKRLDEVGKNCRMTARVLDELRLKNKLSDGVDLPNGGKLKILLQKSKTTSLPEELTENKTDNKILALAKELTEKENEKVIVVSKDINLRIKADAINIEAEDYEKNKVNIDDLYDGVLSVTLPDADFDMLIQNKKIEHTFEFELLANEGIIVKKQSDEKSKKLAIYDKSNNFIRLLKYNNERIGGIKALNLEQNFAMELLLNDDIKLVSLIGFAGTGKTLLSLAIGLQKVLEEGKYTKLLVSRPIIPLGKDIGFLPGDVMEKLMPRMQPINDNLEFLLKESNKMVVPSNELENLIENGIIELEAVTYIRGRSIPEQFMVVDEAQNLTPHEIKTIITRAGEGTKIVLTGDPYQIDHPYLDANSNGLTYLVERFKGHEIFGHVTFKKGERSGLAQIAAEILQ